MSLDITNFFKILWNDEDLNNKPTSTTSNTTNVVSEGNNGNDVLPTPIMPHNADNAGTELNSSGWSLSVDFSLETADDYFSYQDPNAKAYFIYSTKTDPKNNIVNELTHDFLVQNPWVVEVMSGGDNNNMLTTIIAYQAKEDTWFDLDFVSEYISLSLPTPGPWDFDFYNFDAQGVTHFSFSGDDNADTHCDIIMAYTPN